MDQKRGNAAVTRQGASKTSVNSRQVGGGNVARKYGSEVSLTPSQAKQGAENPRKSPLDALSRLNHRQDPFQRRSGLQDVDDSFMASNAFARPSRVRHTGLEAANQQMAANAAVAPLRVAAGQEAAGQMQQQQLPPQSVQMGQPAVASMSTTQMPQQLPAAGQQQQQLPPAAQQSMPQQQQQQQQQPQQYMPPPAAGQPTRHEPYATGRAHVQHQQQQQQQQAAYEQQAAQQEPQAQVQAPAPVSQMSPRKFQQQQQQQQQQLQQGYAGQPSAAAAAGAPPSAEMCTTCPNCQTTIYLVRTPEMGHGDAGMPLQ
ncbi:hypothetical protein ACLKA6_018505 [Drosophila palustris]